MAEEMKAIFLQSPDNIAINDASQKPRNLDKILIRVRSLGSWGSEIGAFMGTNPLASYPRVVGHEVAGEVVEIPADEKSLAVGDPVFLELYFFCGKCYPCLNYRTNCCENLTVFGVHMDGAMAECFAHPRHLVHKVPKEIAWNLVAMVEPLTISMHAVKRSRVKSGEHVVITGAGLIGLLAARYTLTLGAVQELISHIAAYPGYYLKVVAKRIPFP